MKLRRFVIALAIAFALTAAPRALAQDAASQPGSVSGRVTLDGEPAAGVSVRLPWSDAIPNHPRPLTAVTDADGRYRIEGVAPGKYFLAPFKPGYVGPNYGGGYAGKHVNVGPGEGVENVDVELTRGGVISGRVTDPEGRPVIQATISLARVTAGGSRETQQLPFWTALQTDDRGVYRVFGVPAGSYLVSAGGAQGPMGGGGGVPASYHPHGASASDATPVTVGPGAEVLGVDIAVGGPRKVYSATGVVVDEATGAPIAGTIVFASREPEAGSGDEEDEEDEEGDIGVDGGFMEPATTNSRGEFRFSALASGKYTVRIQEIEMLGATAGWYSDAVPFTVDGDTAGIEVRARQGAIIAGAVVVEGGADAAVTAKLQSLMVLGRTGSGGPLGSGSAFTRVAADGTFALKGLPPGDVAFMLLGMTGRSEFTLRRIEQNGVELPKVTVGQGERVANVRLVVVHGSGSVRGLITFTGGALPAGYSALVELKETDRGATVGAAGGFVDGPGRPVIRVDERGRFLAENVPPGTYEVNVVASRGDGGDPVTLTPDARQRVTVAVGQTSEVALRVDLADVKFGDKGDGDGKEN